MNSILKLIAGFLTTVLSVSPIFSGKTDAPEVPSAPINNGTLMLYEGHPNPDRERLVNENHEQKSEQNSEQKPEQKSEEKSEKQSKKQSDKQSEKQQLDIDDKQSESDGGDAREEESLPVVSRNISAEREDLSGFTARDGVILQRTFRPELGESYVQLHGGGQARNATEIPNERLLNESKFPPEFVPERNGEPQVLIIHTHTTESYNPSGNGYYDSEYDFRSLDSSKNMVAVGAKIAEEIAKEGFGVIHDGTLHDYPNYTGSYKRSADTIKSILKEYPSIKMVLDIHRDAIEDDEGAPIAAVAQVNGREASQIMIISPADTADGEWEVPDYIKNFRFASSLQSRADEDNPGLMRALFFEYCNYNLDITPGSLLIEIGSHGNTLEQSLYAGELLGRSIGKLMTQLTDN